MKRIVVVAVIGLTALTLVGAAPAAASGTATRSDARSPEVMRTGSCSGSSAWKLKLSPDNGRIEVDLEVHQARANERWRVWMRHNGTVFYRAAHRTDATGSFDVSRRTANRSGTDRFRIIARNGSTGEVCIATGRF